MPHAEDTSMPTSMVNGEQASSKFISHLCSYPVVSDSIKGFKSNPYGAKSLSLASSANDTFVAPIVPYARRPYSYVQPYVARCDQMADTGLKKVDERWPAVKDDAHTIQTKVQSTAKGYAAAPVDAFVSARDYLVDTYLREYKRCGQDGLVAGGKAVVTTYIAVAGDTLNWISEFVSGKTKEGQSAIQQKMN